MTQGTQVDLGRRNQITLPKKFIPQNTSSFLCEKYEDGTIVLIPQANIPVSQLYFWSKRWQEGEKMASEDIHRGRLHRASSSKDLFKKIEQRRRKR